MTVPLIASFPCPPRLAGLTLCEGCPRPILNHELTISTMLGFFHLGCASPDLMAIAGCPECGERHPQPYDGTCLL